MSAEASWIDAMRRGDFRAAHTISDAVLAARDLDERDDPSLPYHRRWVWDGQDFDGRDVLVRCYHGLGDTIQFARYLPELRRRAASVSVEMQPELFGLLSTNPGIDRLIPFRPSAPAPPAERDVEIMELAHALRLDALGDVVPYFSVRPAKLDRRSGLNIGLCWQSGGWDDARSVPFERLRKALAIPGVHCWCLQHRQEHAGDSPALRGAVPAGADVLMTAAVIAALDVIVTVDTMVAHLAGALGRQTCLLLRRDCDWRWMTDGCHSPWYPATLLYRQDVEGDWSGPLARLRADLRVRVAAAGC
ncbi:MAG: hypothetical protein J0H99_18800 [Rhodospirillales bacterium]|nr:hypothetical protein [Rhodospirillales bacterium]